MKQILVAFLLLSFFDARGQKDPSAETYLNRLSNELDPSKALEITFDYVRENLQEGSEMEGSGTLVLMGDKYMTDLDDVMLFFDGKKQYAYQKMVEEVYVSEPDPENKDFMFSDPIRLLRNYKEEFKYRLIGDTDIAGTPSKELQLYPEELGSPFALVKLFFSNNSGELLSIIIRQKDGVLYTMTVSKMEQIEDPGADYFRFDPKKYPNVDIIELI